MREWDDSLTDEYEIEDDDYPIPVEDVEIHEFGTFNPTWLSPWVDFLRKSAAVREKRLAHLLLLLAVIIVTAGGIIFTRYLFDNAMAKSDKTEDATDIFTLINVQKNEELSIDEDLVKDNEAKIKIYGQVAAMSREEKAAGLFIATADALCGKEQVSSASDIGDALKNYPISAIILTAENINSKKQLQKLISQARKSAAYPLLIGLSDKNNEAESLKKILKDDTLRDFGAVAGLNDGAASYEAGFLYGGHLLGLGFDFTLGPMADTAAGEDPLLRGVNVYGYSQGLQEAGIATCLYTFPGEGAATGDALSLSFTLDETLADLKQKTFQPFSSGIRAGAKYVMVSFLRLAPPAGDGKPSAFSDVVVWQYLRGMLGFSGLVVTAPLDILEQGGEYTKKEAVTAALNAGIDLIYIEGSGGMLAEYYEAVLEALEDGTLSESVIDEALIRIKVANS